MVSTPFSFASCSARRYRSQLSSLYNTRTKSLLERSSGVKRPVKNPRACADHEKIGRFVFSCHANIWSSTEIQSLQYGSCALAKLRFGLLKEKPIKPLFFA